MRCPSLLLFALLLGSTPGWSRNLQVPQHYPTLAAALQEAVRGDSVLVEPGVYLEHSLIQLGGVALVGRGDPGSVVIQGDGAHRLLQTGTSRTGTLIRGVRFRGGRATSGAGLRVHMGSIRIESCIFDGNEATTYGGALSLDGVGACEVVQCTFAGNTAPLGAALHVGPDQAPTLSHCLLAYNHNGAAVEVANLGQPPTLTNCDIADNPGGNWTGVLAEQVGLQGNLSAPPVFCDTVLADWRLAANSPCLPELNPDGEWIGALGEGCAAPDFLAAFTVDQATGPAPHAVQFIDLSSGNPDLWEWDFEGTGVWTAAGPAPSHTYPVAGTYWPRLRVTQDSLVSEATLSWPLRVLFDVTLQADSTVGVRPFAVSFTAQPTGQPLSYEWEFGDGTRVTTVEPAVQHVYHSVGRRTVRVTIQDEFNTAVHERADYLLVQADTLRIPAEATDLLGATELVTNGTVVILQAGAYRLPDGGWTPPPDVQLRGIPGGNAAVLTLSSPTTVPLIRVVHPGARLIIEDLTLSLTGTQRIVAVEDGASLALRRCRLEGVAPQPQARGISLRGTATATVDSCVLGYLGICLLASDSSRMDVNACTFEDSSCMALCADSQGRLNIRHSTIRGTAIFFGGDVRVQDCTWTGNYPSYGISMDGDSLIMERVVFRDCHLEAPFLKPWFGSWTWLKDCAWVYNVGEPYGGHALIEATGTARWGMEGCLMAHNANLGAVSTSSVAPETVSCCDVYGNGAGNWNGTLEPFAGQYGNISAHPRICDRYAPTLQVSSESPCLPDNNSCGMTIGGLTPGCQLTSVTAEFSAAVTQGLTPLTVQFQQQATGPIAQLLWDFESDGNWDSAEPSPVHVYTEPGDWDVTLCVSNAEYTDSLRLEDLVHVHTPRVLRVPGDYSSIAAALASADLADTVEVDCGVYHEQNLTLTDGCMLRSVTRLPDCVRLQGDGTARLLNGTNLPRGIQVEGITLAGGRQPGTGLDGMGGAVLLTDTPAGFRSCIFTDNLARFGGAGVSSSGDSLVLEACVLDRNSAESQCGAWLCTSAIFRLEGCLVTDNSGSNLFNRAPEIVCSDLFGNPAGDWSGAWADQVGERGNLCADPLYCDVPAGDFRLLPDSPCLPPASACGAMGAFPTSCLTDLPPTQQPLDFAVASWPNPFNPVARVQVQLPVSARVELRLFNVAGQLVWEDAADRLAAGRHEWRLDGSAWSSGLYLLDVLAGDQRAVRKLTLLK